ncbi:MAG: nitrophenyl compound nitroreductase subunit ArsF family protein [Candidatus Omnitrophota bacterium]
MRRIFFVVLSLSMLLFAVVLPASAEDSVASKVIVYYFRGSFRCSSCRYLEEISKEGVEKNFTEELASGAIEFRDINIEEKGNEHFAKDYGLYTRSLVLSMEKNGREVKFKNLDKIWEYARDRQKFMDYVSNEIKGFREEDI